MSRESISAGRVHAFSKVYRYRMPCGRPLDRRGSVDFAGDAPRQASREGRWQYGAHLAQRILLRYQDQGMHVWMFSLFKTRLDPMFAELREFLQATPDVRTILDLGCGFGFAGSFLLDHFPQAQIYAVEPSEDVLTEPLPPLLSAGTSFRARPDFEVPGLPERFDAVFVLDVVHFFSDSGLDLTLRRIRTTQR